MLRLFGPKCSPKPVDPAARRAVPKDVLWIDLFDPTPAEEKFAEKLVGGNIPTREELAEIEPSSRLYQKNDAAFMTMSVIWGITDGRPASDPIGFILTDKHLVTVRYVDPKPFIVFAENFYAEPDQFDDAVSLFVRLLDAIVDRLADEFERAGAEFDAISRQIFEHHTHRAKRAPERRLEALLMRIGKAQQLLAKLRETSVSANRLLTFLQSIKRLDGDKENARHVQSLVADTEALNDHANFLGDNQTFLLDATLGLISLEQNMVMKIFSVVAVVLMPPTLVVGVYGMNFDHMPELHWRLGYPFALALILLTSMVPYLLARRKGWL